MPAHARRRDLAARPVAVPAKRHLVQVAADLKHIAPHARVHTFGEWNGNSKHPLAKGGHATATDDLAEVERRAGNPNATGLAVYFDRADGIIALDLDRDPAKGKDGVAELEALAKKHGQQFPMSAFVASPRGNGSGHLYLRVPRGMEVPSSNGRLGRAIDVRGTDGSFWLAAPGSRTARGAYKWERGPEHIIDAPDWLLGEIRNAAPHRRHKEPDADEKLIEPDLPEHVAKARNWLANEARPAIEGQHGDDTTIATAAMLWSYGLSFGTALDLMLEIFNERCQPPWEPDQLEYKVASAYRSHTSAFGNCTDAYQEAKRRQGFKPVEKPQPSGRLITSGRYRIVDRDAMEAIEPPKWLVPGCIPEGGSALLVGARESFKTFEAIDIAGRVERGLPLLGGTEPCAQGDVLLAIGEGRPNYKKRIAAWEARYNGGRRLEGLYLLDPVPAVMDGDAAVDAALEMNYRGFKLVVLDTVGRTMAGLNENAQEHASKYTALVETLQRRLGCAVLGIAHTGHEAEDRMRGSTVFEADADTVLVMRRAYSKLAATITMTKQRDAQKWQEPRAIVCEEVTLPDGSTSLVVAQPTPAQAREAREAPRARGDSPADRTAAAFYLLKALREARMGPCVWSDNKLAICAREHGCTMPLRTLRAALGSAKGVDGWARSDPWLSPYYDRPSETWKTPRRHDLPPLPVGANLDMAPDANSSVEREAAE